MSTRHKPTLATYRWLQQLNPLTRSSKFWSTVTKPIQPLLGGARRYDPLQRRQRARYSLLWLALACNPIQIASANPHGVTLARNPNPLSEIAGSAVGCGTNS